MSTSITTDSLEIPRARQDGWRPDPHDLSQTPGGTLYATTPGGTKIMYNRDALLALSKSPLAKSPLTLPHIPGVTTASPPSKTHVDHLLVKPKIVKPSKVDDDLPFDFEV